MLQLLQFYYIEITKFLESFNLWCPLLMIAFYHQTKTPIGFCHRHGLNFRSLIQPSETLPIKLTGTYTHTHTHTHTIVSVKY